MNRKTTIVIRISIVMDFGYRIIRNWQNIITHDISCTVYTNTLFKIEKKTMRLVFRLKFSSKLTHVSTK